MSLLKHPPGPGQPSPRCHQPGEPIGVVALSGPVERDELEAGLAHLSAWGCPIIAADNLTSRTPSGHLAGTDDERLGGLLHVLDQGARTVIAARGGFGVTRLLDRIPWQQLISEQVIMVGFSDLTAVLLHLASAGGAIQVHGPMVCQLHRDPVGRERLYSVLTGAVRGDALYTYGPTQVVRPGRATGRAVGGNLAVLAATLGTSYAPDLTDAVLFLEDVGEPLYRLDRLLTQLRGSGRLNGVKALIGGSLHRCTGLGHGRQWWRQLLAEGAGHVPVVVDVPFGHLPPHLAFPSGVEVTVDTGSGLILWSG